MASQKLYHPGMKSNLRLTVKVDRGTHDTYHYDVGIAAIEDPQHRLSQYNEAIRPLEPRFLEDYIEVYGKENISVHEWGKYAEMEVREHDLRNDSVQILYPKEIATRLLA